MIHSSQKIDEILGAIKKVVGDNKVSLHEPNFSGNEWYYVKQCLDSTYVSSVGKFVDQFESDLAHFTGAKHVIAVVNGTSGLHIALLINGVKPNDEVMIPALTFAATAAAVKYCGAIPHLVESEKKTLGVDAKLLREYLLANTEIRNGQCINLLTNRVIRAIVPMHTFGHPVNVEELLSVAHDFQLRLIEDAAESLGSLYDGKHTGTFGLAGVLSFNGNKIITTGGGGAILTNDTSLARMAKHLSTTAKLPHRWEYAHDEVGYNYRMPNINAALGCAQLEQLADFLSQKRMVFQSYKEAFSKILDVSIFEESSRCKSNYWLNALILDESLVPIRDGILEATNRVDIITRPIWKLVHHLLPYSQCPRMNLDIAESLERRIINLPSSSILSNK